MCCTFSADSFGKNLAIVFTPVLFHDETEPLGQIAWSQGPKMMVVELLISQYPLIFSSPLEPVYKPPPQPGEVRDRKGTKKKKT